MATSTGTMEEHLTCGICLEIYKNPHALKCLHTYCLCCIDGLKQGNKVLCPDCRKSTAYDAIQKEFKVQGMVDVHTNRSGSVRQGSAKIVAKVCEVCAVVEKEVRAYCKTCEEFMCGDCERAHKGSKASRDHSLTQYSALYEAKMRQLSEHIERLQKEKELMYQQRLDIAKERKMVRLKEREQLSQIKQRKEDLHEQIDSFYSKVTQELESFHKQKYDALEGYAEAIQGHADELETKITFLSDVSQCQDIDILNNTLEQIGDMIKTLLCHTKVDIQGKEACLQIDVDLCLSDTLDLKPSLQLMFRGDRSYLQKPKPFDQQPNVGITKAEVIKSSTNPKKKATARTVDVDFHFGFLPIHGGIDSGHLQSQKAQIVKNNRKPHAYTESDFPQLQGCQETGAKKQGHSKHGKLPKRSVTCNEPFCEQPTGFSNAKLDQFKLNENRKSLKARYKQMKNKKVDICPLHLCAVGEMVFCASDEDINVYSNDYQHITCIHVDCFQSITGLSQMDTGEIAISDRESGIMVLDPTWSEIRIIDDEGICAVTVFGKTIYTLQCEKCKIQAYAKTKDGQPTPQWDKLYQISLPYKCGTWSDSLLATKNHLVVCSITNDCLYILSRQSGRLMFSVDITGPHGPSYGLFGPRLCDVDDGENILICNNGQSRVQAYNVSSGQWGISLEPQNPVSAAFTEDGIWVGAQPKNNTNKLIRYAAV